MSLVTIAINSNERRKYMQQLDIYCTKQLDTFWECINDTLKDLDIHSHWSGRPCCHLPSSTNCQFTCLMSHNRSSLLNGCRQSDEISFYNCLDHQEVGEKCCSSAKTSDCKEACRDVFMSNSHAINYLPQRNVETLCSQNSPSVVNCVLNFTGTTPSTQAHKNIHCCERSDNEKCRATCRKTLKEGSHSQEVVIDTLIHGGCGYPLLHDNLWQCFLSNSEINRPSGAGALVSSNSKRKSSILYGIGGKLGSFDSAKLHCCLKASSFSCQKLCFKTFSDDWEITWRSFHRLCMYQPSESKMHRCIEEVDEPCELGCDGLSYCNHFNNQPTQMFRSCNTWTDHGARSEVEMWKTGFINTSSINIPILDTGQCLPSMLKSIACTLAIKPCSTHHSFAGLCRSDCIETLNKCVDYKRFSSKITPSAICDMLLPNGQDVACTPLNTYLKIGTTSNSHYTHRDEVIFPCRPNPCNSSHICLLNRDCRIDDDSCLRYKCVPGCRMGGTSHFLVPTGTIAYIPSSSLNSGCYKICRCSSNSAFEECITLPCQSTDGCLIGGKRILHQSTFQFDCNTCLCFAEEVMCTTQECTNTIGSRITDGIGYLCNCPSHYAPVCGVNGRTYPSACVAMCFGLTEEKITFGSCSSVDPCQKSPCKRNQICIPDKKICLSSDESTQCEQYLCLDKAKDCDERSGGAFCDTRQQQFSSMCSLISQGRTLAYKGNCIKNCINAGPVCGQNGETYQSECSALAARTLVDYVGSCTAFGKTAGSSNAACESIICPKPALERCLLVTPPGACCSICGAAIRLLINQRQTQQIQRFLSKDERLTVQDIVDAFRQQIKVSTCEVYGYLTADGEVVLVLTTQTQSPTLLQLEACSKEAEKLEFRINTGSPLVVSDFKLSSIMLAISVDAHNWSNLLLPSNLCLLISLIAYAFMSLSV
ncbi:hypothetical protein CHUAL_002148 [Chamberlinius hualienensis]